MKKIPKITKKQFDSHTATVKSLDSISKQLETRINYIGNKIHKVCKTGIVRNDWFLLDAHYSLEEFMSELVDKTKDLYVYMDLYSANDDGDLETAIFLKGTKKQSYNKLYYLHDCFPKRWLFEDFEAELIEGYKAYLAFNKAQNLKLEQKMAKKKASDESAKEKSIASIKEKLTTTEFKQLAQYFGTYYSENELNYGKI